MPVDPTHHAAPQVAERLTVVVRRVLFANAENGYFVAEAEVAGEVKAPEGALRPSQFGPDSLLLKGESPSFVENPILQQGMEVLGRWANDARGTHFEVFSTQEHEPTSPEALRKYLVDGRVKGIGPKTAHHLVDQFGLDLLRILDHDPGRLAGEPGINAEKAERIGQTWKEKREMFRVTAFLGLHSIGENLAKKVAAHFGSEGLEEKIRANPYLLTEVEGIAFNKADAAALSLGVPRDNPMRIQAALVHVLGEKISNEGHTAIPTADWVNEAMNFVGQSRLVVEDHCRLLHQQRRVVFRRLPCRRVVRDEVFEEELVCATPMRLGMRENAIAQDLLRLMTISPNRDERPKATDSVARQRMLALITAPDRKLDPSQIAAATLSVNQPVSILTGGPGTGKTTTLRTLVQAFEDEGLTVVLAAPTGIAAKRMEDAIGRPAATMHRALQAQGTQGFQRNRTNPLEGDVFILDETSMVDTVMMASWLESIPSRARVLFVGDADQLPSVGAGNVLRDLIESRQIPVARLTKVHRNGGAIALAAQKVLAGVGPTGPSDPWVDSFAFVPAADDEAILESIDSLVDGYLNKGHAPHEIQVLVPQREGPLGFFALNDRLRWKLNPNRPDPRTSAADGFLDGERVMQLKNDYKREVFNGDVGHILENRSEGAGVEMEDGRRVDYKKEELKQLQMAYAITVHKSQGTERPVIILVCSTRHQFSLNRNLIYTGITRGKQRVVIVGQPKALVMGARKRDQLVRRTGLIAELKREKAKLAPKPAPAVAPSSPRPAPPHP
jgi:exodeoxyribonuclease V alpha subunit